MKHLTFAFTTVFIAILFTACSSTEDYHDYDFKKSVQWLSTTPANADSIPALFKKNNIRYEAIGKVNWQTYQYKPYTTFAIAYTDSAILLHFTAEEQHLRAFQTQDLDSVWTDACVEFFFDPNKGGNYYEISTNCTAHVFMSYGDSRYNRVLSERENLQYIKRWASLGTQAYPIELEKLTPWELALIIPFKVFFRHDIQSIAGLKAKANFYKCGGSGEFEHYLTWKPIETATPDFHQPAYFKEITFVAP